MGYWDTSALVKLYAKEPDSALFQAQVLQTPSVLVMSRIGLYETRATFQRKEAENILQPGSTQKLYNELLQDINAGELRLVELDSQVEQQYGQVLTFCYQQSPAIHLRTLDALHLSSARVAGETQLVTTDNRMREAAKKLGFSLFPV